MFLLGEIERFFRFEAVWGVNLPKVATALIILDAEVAQNGRPWRVAGRSFLGHASS